MKYVFSFKSELPKTIEELNNFERRQYNEDNLYDTVMVVLYAMIFLTVFCMAGSFIAEKLTTFESQIQKSFSVSNNGH